MADLSKVVIGLECCDVSDESADACLMVCPYYGERSEGKVCVDFLIRDALELLRGIPRTCEECAHQDKGSGEEPCRSCGSKGDEPPSNWRWKHDS